MAISAHIETNIIEDASVGQTNVWLKSDCDKTKFYESLWKKNKKCYQGKNKNFAHNSKICDETRSSI